MEKQSIVGLAVLTAILLILGCLGYGEQQPATTSVEQVDTIKPAAGEVKEFTMTAFRFGFDPNTITVNNGDTVRLKITSTDVTHGFAISEFGVNKRLEPGKTITVEFVADKTGTFTYACSVACGSGHSGMRGQLIVE